MTNSLDQYPPAAWSVPPVPTAVVLEPPPATPYQHLYREPDRRWWRPLVSLGVLVGSYLVVAFILSIALAVLLIGAVMAMADPEGAMADPNALLADLSGWSSVGVLLMINLMLAALIPAVLLANRVAHRLPAGYTHSVVGRFRFGWAAKVTAALVPLWVVYLAVSFVLEPFDLFTHAEPWAVTAAIVGVVLLTTPLQAAGEEYLFRGWFLQNLGLLIPRPVIAVVVPTAISAGLFALAHGSLDGWILFSLVVMAATAAWMTVRTGGLEAAVAFHSVNNVVIFLFQAGFGLPVMASMISTDTTSTWVSAVVGAVFTAFAVVVVEWLARREGIAPTR